MVLNSDISVKLVSIQSGFGANEFQGKLASNKKIEMNFVVFLTEHKTRNPKIHKSFFHFWFSWFFRRRTKLAYNKTKNI